MVSIHLKNISRNGNLPQVGVKIKNIWNHHLEIHSTLGMWSGGSSRWVFHHQAFAVGWGWRRRAGFGRTRRQPSSSKFFFGYHWDHASKNLHPKKLKQQQVVERSIYKFTKMDFRKKKKRMISWQKFLGQLHQKTHLWAVRSAPRNLPPQKLPPLRNKGWIIGLPSSLYTIRPYQPLFFGETFHALFTVRGLKSSPATPTHEPSRVVRKGFFWNPATFPY